MNKKKSKTLQRLLTLILGVGFAGSTLFVILGSFLGQNSNSTSNPDNKANNTPSIEEQAQIQARGYEKVLEREPKNITALTGLVEIYLQTGNIDKAIPVLEKLVEFYPEQQEFNDLLQAIKQQPVTPAADVPKEP